MWQVSVPFQSMEFHESGVMGLGLGAVECVCEGVRVKGGVVTE